MGREKTEQTKIKRQPKIINIFGCFAFFVCFVISPVSYSIQDFDKIAAQATQARESNRLDEAISLYREALRLNPKWAEGWFYLGSLFHDRDNHAEAARAFKEATDLNPGIGTAWVMLGLSEFNLGRYDDALKHIQKGRQLGITDNPNLRNVMLYHEGLLLLDKEDYENAHKALASLGREGVESENLIAALGLAVLRLRPSALPSLDETTRAAVGRAGQAEY
ncbi:MAG: tetratricopeptide repeat protein, partial [Blastocatellia bacterium]|nr:tetratricopeptide repeat protein [Blastocatellia bacterium]